MKRICQLGNVKGETVLLETLLGCFANVLHTLGTCVVVWE